MKSKKDTYKNGTVNINYYSSPFDFIEEGREIHPKSKNASKNTDKPEWFGSNSYEDWINIYNGDPIPDELGINNLNIGLNEEYVDSYKQDVTGQFFDVGMLMSGEPECFFEQVNSAQESKFVTVVFNHCESAKTSNSALMRKAKLCAGLVNKYESDKHTRVQIFIMISSKQDEKEGGKQINDLCIFPVKKYNESLQPHMANSFHTSLFRRSWFAYVEKYYPHQTYKGYGAVNTINQFSKADILRFVGSEKNTHLITFDSTNQDQNLKNVLQSGKKEDIENYINKIIGSE